MSLQVQTRSDSFGGPYPGTNTFKSIKDAYTAFEQDQNIWKVSWSDEKNRHRWITKTTIDIWGEAAEKKLCELSEEYASASKNNSKTLFWVDQTLLISHVEMKKIKAKYSKDVVGIMMMTKCIRAVLTDKQFQENYCE
jgi:hypothetical protein